MKIEISIVIPIFNEEKNINALHTRLTKTLSSLKKSYEIIFVDDGSHDKSSDILLKLSQKDPHIKIISFTRNFGHMQAINAGLKFSSGDKIVVMDADLQDPPELIPKLYAKSKTGYQIVYAVKTQRKEHHIKRFAFSYFYRLLNLVSKLKMPTNAGTFSIIDKEVSKILIDLPERNKYFSGLRTWTGFSQIGIAYKRGKRLHGKSKSIFKLISMATDSIFSFSYLPLKLASFFGFILSITSFIFIVLVLISRIIFAKGVVGWASTLTVILFIGGVQLITLGIIGEYIARIYDEVKNRPDYVIKKKVGFKK